MPVPNSPNPRVWVVGVQAETPVGPWRYSLWTVASDRDAAAQAALNYLAALCPGSSLRVIRRTPVFGLPLPDLLGRVIKAQAAAGYRRLK